MHVESHLQLIWQALQEGVVQAGVGFVLYLIPTQIYRKDVPNITKEITGVSHKVTICSQQILW